MPFSASSLEMLLLSKKKLIPLALILVMLGYLETNASEFLRKQTGSVTISGGSTSSGAVAIPIEVDMSKSFLVFSSSVSNASPTNFQIGGEITNSTTLTFSRTGTGGAVTIKWQIFEFESGVFVQHGSQTSVARATNVDVSINCVDLSKSFVLLTGRKSGTTLGSDDGVTGNLIDQETLRLFITGPAGGNYEEVYWQVVEYQASIVKKVATSLNAGVASTTSNLTALTGSPVSDIAKTMVISNHGNSANINSDDLARTELTDANTVTYTRVGTTGQLDYVTYVIEFTDASTVAHNSITFTNTEISKSTGITATSSSGVFGSGNYGRQGSTSYSTDDNTGHVWFTYEIINPTTIQIDRAVGTATTTSIAPFQIVTFDNSGLQQDTFYSLASGDWEDNTSWSFSSDGSTGAVPTGVFPNQRNNVVIRNSHVITVDAIDDNAGCATSPDDLGSGPFTSSGVDMFYQTGNIIIDAGGTLTLSTRHIFEGYTYVNGTLNSTADIVNRGSLEVTSSATFSTGDDLILSGNSSTILDNTTVGFDDLYIDNTSALLCGSGILNVGNGAPDPIIQYLNGATSTQVCSSITVQCVGTPAECTGFSPPSPTGNFSLGYTGPGGVADTDGNTELVLWLDANTISQGTGTNLSTWSDQSGYGNDASPVDQAPEFNTNQINGFPAVEFDVANPNEYLSVANAASLNPTRVSLFCVGNITSSASSNSGLITKVQDITSPYDGYGLVKNGGNLQSLFAINQASQLLNSTNSYVSGEYVVFEAVYNQTTQELYHNENSEGSLAYTTAITTNTNSLYLGIIPDAAGTGVVAPLDGDIAEAIVIGRDVNAAERIIIANYLSAKYNIALSANDVYLQDDDVGEFDFEVAGIGQASDGTFNKDAQGTGLVRMNLPSDLNNDEYLMWGHDNTDLNTVNTTDVDGTIIEARLERVWRVSENDNTGAAVDVGTVRLTFNLSNLPPTIVGSDMRLLITRDDALFIDNDVTPQAGSYNIDNQLVTFSNVSFQDGDYFTLGTTDNTNSPLPIELISFSATNVNGKIELEWQTASEKENDFFTVERSDGIGEWQNLGTVDGSGNSTSVLKYEFWDSTPMLGGNYYRLKQTDFNGSSTYSAIRLVILSEIDLISVYPNPFDQSFTIYGNLDFVNSDVSLYNVLGVKVSIKVEPQNDRLQIKSDNLKSGVYFLKVLMNNSVRTLRIVKQ